MTIRAAAWQNQQTVCAASEDSDQPQHPPSLIRVFTVRMKKPWVLSYPLNAQRRLWSDWVDAQADQSSLGAHSFCWFCHVVAHKYLDGQSVANSVDPDQTAPQSPHSHSVLTLWTLMEIVKSHHSNVRMISDHKKMFQFIELHPYWPR